ncbi:MAG: TolC family protein [Deltaproteobacteria bacterium]|nr:TolC family protein [Deltaproteobacteria bacterium]
MRHIRKTIFTILLMLACAPALAGDEAVLSWQECVIEAAKANPELAASLHVVEQRKAEKWVETSPLLPQFTTEASISRVDNFSGTGRRDNNTYSVRGEQLLFDGFKAYSDFKSAEQALKASEETYTVASSDIRYNLRKAFVELLKSQTLVPITAGIIERRKQNLGMIRLRYESGREHEGSLLLAEADFAQAEYDHRKANRDISVAQYELRKTMGWYDDRPIRAKGSFKLHKEVGAKPNLRKLAENHPIVQRSLAEKGAAKYELKAAKAEFFPEFNAYAEAGKVRGGGFSNSSNGWLAGLSASLPILEGGRRIANTDRARAKLMEAKSNEVSEYDTVLTGLETAWQNLKDAVELYRVRNKYLKADEVRAKISRAQYANGLLIFDNWIIIEDNYVRSQKSNVEAEANMLIAEAEWIRAKGETLNYE